VSVSFVEAKAASRRPRQRVVCEDTAVPQLRNHGLDCGRWRPTWSLQYGSCLWLVETVDPSSVEFFICKRRPGLEDLGGALVSSDVPRLKRRS